MTAGRRYSTNYATTLILASADCLVTGSVIPGKAGTVAVLQYALLIAAPYTLTSDALLLAVAAQRKNTPPDKLAELEHAMFSRPQACLRASPLVKNYGWGLHHDAKGRIALVGSETARFQELVADPATTKVAGMRSRRA